MKTKLMFGLLTLACASVALLAQAPEPASVRLAVDGRANATPWVDASGDFVAVAWGATLPQGGADVFVAISRDAARSFSAPVRVNATAGEARLGGELPPRVVLQSATTVDEDPIVTVTWGAKTATTEIRQSRSTDGGRTFLPHTTVSAPGVAGDRGWHATAIDRAGMAHTIWLDHRALAARPKSGTHDHHTGIDMSQFSSLYHAARGDQGREAERELTPNVCYCCKTALVVAESGAMYAAWRHVYPGNIRDIAFMTSKDGGRTFSPPVRVSEDNWHLAGCPDDGPAMAVDGNGTVHLVWPTVIGGETPQGAIFYSSTRDGRNFRTRLRVPTRGSPKPSHPQIVADDRGLVIAWDEVINGVRQASSRRLRFTREGQPTFGDLVVFDPVGTSSYPVLAVTSRGVIAVWTSGMAAEIRVAALRN